MRISRLYLNDSLNTGQNIELNDDAAHYLRSVLRLKKDAEVILFNGLGGEYRCTLLEVSRKTVCVSINEKIDRSVESSLNVTIGMGISRGDRMDMAIQKSVELGVNSIIPLITQRCNVVIKADKAEQKIKHWQKIAQHAAEQSGRTVVPKIHPIAQFPNWIEQNFDEALKIFLDPYSNTVMNQLKNESDSVLLLTGSEGGFCEQERDSAIAKGFSPICLGQRILRTETASLAALAAVQTLWGDFS
ncbi:MAG: 16S rRNA (uracil(1498)-N(3))-methyltransferase [Methylococcaceae bacterium]|nr:16S rRNA (uracil(1498)-N(3))-methyltransferase [Methylococcaceae bacterium]